MPEERLTGKICNHTTSHDWLSKQQHPDLFHVAEAIRGPCGQDHERSVIAYVRQKLEATDFVTARTVVSTTPTKTMISTADHERY